MTVLGLVLGPRLVDGGSALAWVRYHAARGRAVLPEGDAPRAGRWTARAVDLLAPLPQAREAARLGLDLGRSLEAESPKGALAVYTPVREALDRACASPVRGIGLGALAGEARALEARARAAGPAGR
ncbi:MAG: hypothetical protein HY317_05405 [Acidobacteria bacterium]|nr:hypothetical protein [Acidobacteriota bacterium]